MLDEDVAAGRLDTLGARHAFNRVSPTTEWTGLELADLVVEAVVETMDAKREVFAQARPPDAPRLPCWRRNTSSLPVAEIAEATLHRERVVGLHFFNPVPKMPLVEVVRGAAQRRRVAGDRRRRSRAQIGKTPVLVNDAPGFLVNRVLDPVPGRGAGDGRAKACRSSTIDDGDEALGHADGPVRAARRDRPGHRRSTC